MSAHSSVKSNTKSFARKGVMSDAGLWERGSEASASDRVFPHAPPYSSPSGETALSSREGAGGKAPALHGKTRAPKAPFISPSGDTRPLPQVGAKGKGSALPTPKENTKADNFGWNAGPREISNREINEALIGREVARDTFLDGRIRESDAGERPNMMLAITRPMPKFTQRMEPCVIVQDYTGNFADMIAANGLEGVASEAQSIFAARVNASASVCRAASSGGLKSHRDFWF